jgi:hypothetical protein
LLLCLAGSQFRGDERISIARSPIEISVAEFRLNFGIAKNPEIQISYAASSILMMLHVSPMGNLIFDNSGAL